MYAVQRVDARIRASVWMWVFGAVAIGGLRMSEMTEAVMMSAEIIQKLRDENKKFQSKLDKIQAIVDSGYCDPYDLRKILDVV